SLGQITTSGLQFATGGYVLTGQPLTLLETTAGSGASTVRVGDGSASVFSDTVSAVLQGSVELVKTDVGTLVLTGNNTYTGGTAINGGTLQISSDANLGAAASALSLDGGTLHTTTNLNLSRATTLNAGGGTFDASSGTTLTLGGVIGGTGALTKTDSGILV